MGNGKIILIGAGLVAALALAKSKKSPSADPVIPVPEPPAGGTNASDVGMTIGLYDSKGNQIVHNSPYPLPEGEMITLKITTHNKSRQTAPDGSYQLIPVNISLSVDARLTNGPVLLDGGPGGAGYLGNIAYTADQAKDTYFAFSVPWNTDGMIGKLAIRVSFPDGKVKDASADLNVVSAALVYDVDISFV